VLAKKRLTPRESRPSIESLEDKKPSREYLDKCWQAAVKRDPLRAPIDDLKGKDGVAYAKASISGRDVAEALDFLSEALGDEAFWTAALALRAYGISAGGVKQDTLRLLRTHGGEPEWIVMPHMALWVYRGLAPRAAAMRTAAQHGVPGPSFDTVVKNLERTWRDYSSAGNAPAFAPIAGDTGRKLRVRLLPNARPADGDPALKEIMGVAFDADGFGVAPDTREWRRWIHEGHIAFYGIVR
jgi:hypothetical protein